jgi:hypothetical protein
VETVLGLVGLVLFICFIIALAAGVTWVVVKLTRNPNAKSKAPKQKPPAPAAE